MKIRLIIISALIGAVSGFGASAQTTEFLETPGLKNPDVPENSADRVFLHGMQGGRRKLVRIPDVPGYKTLKCDFHIHTIYADAEVYPKGRVREAWADGLDVIAMTEHIGTFKNKIENLTDQNLPWEIAAAEGRNYGMIVVHGAEITREKPFGHMNALFVKDCNAFAVNKYAKDKNGKTVTLETGWRKNDPKTMASDIKAAIDQDCFILWNHPGWPDKKSDFYTIQKELLDSGHLNGIELCNHSEWYPKVLDWFDEFHIPMFANTDCHNPTNLDFGRCIRPMTLVLAEEYTEESLREAMFEGRILAFFDQKLAGDAKWVEALVRECLKLRVIDEEKGIVEITNVSDIELQTLWDKHMSPVIFYPGTALRTTLKKGSEVEFINCFVGARNLKIQLW